MKFGLLYRLESRARLSNPLLIHLWGSPTRWTTNPLRGDTSTRSIQGQGYRLPTTRNLGKVGSGNSNTGLLNPGDSP